MRAGDCVCGKLSRSSAAAPAPATATAQARPGGRPPGRSGHLLLASGPRDPVQTVRPLQPSQELGVGHVRRGWQAPAPESPRSHPRTLHPTFLPSGRPRQAARLLELSVTQSARLSAHSSPGCPGLRCGPAPPAPSAKPAACWLLTALVLSPPGPLLTPTRGHCQDGPIPVTSGCGSRQGMTVCWKARSLWVCRLPCHSGACGDRARSHSEWPRCP